MRGALKNWLANGASVLAPSVLFLAATSTKRRTKNKPHALCLEATTFFRARARPWRAPSRGDGRTQAVLAWQAERQLCGLQPLPAWQAEIQLRGLQSMPAWQGETQMRRLQGLPAWQGEIQLRGLQPVPAWQGERQLRGLQGLPAW
jgi:hypothetical protein